MKASLAQHHQPVDFAMRFLVLAQLSKAHVFPKSDVRPGLEARSLRKPAKVAQRDEPFPLPPHPGIFGQ